MSSQNSPEQVTDPQERADWCHKLAQRAENRLDSQSRMEWRAFLALWAGLGLGSYVVINAQGWAPGFFEIFLAMAVVAALLFGCCRWWLPYLSTSLYRDSFLSYYWESQIENSLRLWRPRFLRPPKAGGDTWPSAADDDPNHVFGNPDTDDRRLPADWHLVQWAQLTVTSLFCLLLLVAMMSKGCADDSSPKSSLRPPPTAASTTLRST